MGFGGVVVVMGIKITNRRSVLLTWSGGKDSCMALDALLSNPAWEVRGLLSTVSSPYDRVSMHGVRRELLVEQAASLGLPLDLVWLEAGASNEEYEKQMAQKLSLYLAHGTLHVAFGDIFLEELRRYREANLARLGMEGVFPLWGTDTRELLRAFMGRGFRAVITCVDTLALDGSFVGRELDQSLVKDFPPTVDPCGENGEFHSFVYDGPLFVRRVGFQLGDVVEREGGRFVFQDLVPIGSQAGRAGRGKRRERADGQGSL